MAFEKDSDTIKMDIQTACDLAAILDTKIAVLENRYKNYLDKVIHQGKRDYKTQELYNQAEYDYFLVKNFIETAYR